MTACLRIPVKLVAVFDVVKINLQLNLKSLMSLNYIAFAH